MTLQHPTELAHLPFNPLAPVVLADPYPFYAWLRDHDPVHWGVGGGQDAGCWYITSYDLAVAALKEPRLGREIDQVLPERVTSPPDPAAAALIHAWMVLRDPPAHTYLRGLVQRAFTPQMIERWTPRMAAIAENLVAPLADGAPFDLMQAVAVPFPVQVVAELLGVPPEDAPLFSPWTKALAAVIEFEQTPDVQARGAAAMRELADYLRTVIAARRRQPQADLISALLVQENDLSPRSPLPEEVLLGACTQLLFGGNDPVAHLFGNGLLALLRHPAQWAWLHAQPALTNGVVDELMRYDASVQMTFRYVLEEMTLHNQRLRPGDLVAIVFGAANRDERQFARADELDLTRTANRHLALGQGIHYCLGAALARTEGRVMFDTLRCYLPHAALVDTVVNWQPTVAVRGVTELRISA